MAKATIKSSGGTVITVEGSEGEVLQIISAYEKMNSDGRSKSASPRSSSRVGDDKKREGASDLIKGLREVGFFDKPKSLGEVSAALEEQGFLYPTTSLSGVVLGLVKKKILRRKKVDGRWVYGK